MQLCLSARIASGYHRAELPAEITDLLLKFSAALVELLLPRKGCAELPLELR